MSQGILKAITPIKVLNLIKIKISGKKEKSLGYPINILIEPTRDCNYQCPQCPRQTYPEIKREMEMSLEEFKVIMNQIGKYLFSIRFWHYGEPLKNKELPKMIRVAKEYNIFTAISSNCCLLSKEMSEGLIEAGLDYLLVSLNAATHKTYKKLTETDNFDRVIRNLKQMVELKRKSPFLNLQFILMKENFLEVNDMIKLSKHIGADKLSFKHLGFKTELGFSKRTNKVSFCSLPYEEAVISANGDVTPCAPDMRNHYVMGNVFKEDFRVIWNNNKYRDFRKKKDIDICKVCGKKNNYDLFMKI